MFKKIFSLITVLAFFCNTSFPILAIAQQMPNTSQNPSVPPNPGAAALPATGARLPSAEEVTKVNSTHKRVHKVHLNRLGWQRANEYRQKHKMATLGENAIAPQGQEMESAIDTSPLKVSADSSAAAIYSNVSSADTVLPDVIDNSATPWFPPIGDQGGLGSCVSFATTYYQLSYAMAKENNWTINTAVADPTKVFSPRWTYNMINGGADNGQTSYGPFELLEFAGAPTWAQFPYNGSDHTSWPSTVSLNTVTVSAGGKGYSIGDVLTVVQNGASAGTLTVNAVNNGIVTGVTVTNPGLAYSLASGLATTGGHGSGCMINVTSGLSPWQTALTQRITWETIPDLDANPNAVQIVRQLLNDGVLIGITTSAPPGYSYDTVTNIKSCTTSTCNPNGFTIDNSVAGQQAIIKSTGTMDHGMTMVGYDDNIWVDINGNGKVDPGEMGAFKIANQWGTGYGNHGFYWYSYDSLNSVSTVANGPNSNRGKIISSPVFLSVRTNPDGSPYVPKVIGQFTFSDAQRYQLNMSLGISAITQKTPSTSDADYYWNSGLKNGGGSIAFTGTAAMDFTDILPSGNNTFYLGIQNGDSSGQYPTTVTDFRLTDSAGNTFVTSNLTASKPLVVDAAQVYSSINYNYTGQLMLNLQQTLGGTIAVTSPATPTFASGSNATITVTPAAGYYVTGLNDNGIGIAPSQMSLSNGVYTYSLKNITVNHNLAASFNPIISYIYAGADFSTAINTSVNLSGAISDNSGARPNISWQTAYGSSSNVTFGTSSGPASGGPYNFQANTSVQFSAPGTYMLQLTATEGTASQFSDIFITVTSLAVAPSITGQPQATVIFPGVAAYFSVAAAGTMPLTYQWMKNGATISGATSSTYSTPTATMSNNGDSYTVKISNAGGSITSSAAALAVVGSPVITTQPLSQTAVVGQTATFSVVATAGNASLTYQWQRNGVNISGATNSMYTTPALTSSNNADKYTVIVSDTTTFEGYTYGTYTLTSNAATLTVNSTSVAPSITTQPVSMTVTAPGTATFSVVANGTPAPTYQWKSSADGVTFANISGATSASYTTAATTTANSGTKFECVATNSVSSVTSSVATLTVNPIPYALNITQPANGTLSVTAVNGKPSSGQASYNLNDVVTLTATPSAGYQMGTWSGATATSNPLIAIVTMATTPMTVTSSFTAIPYLLNIAPLANGGVVVTAVNGKASSGQSSYNLNDVVTLTATPAAGYQMGSWTGVTVMSNPLVATVKLATTPMAVGASFTSIPYILKITQPANGTLLVSAVNGNASSGQTSYNLNDVVSLIATPAPGYELSSWSGTTATGNPLIATVTMSNTPIAVTANFIVIPPNNFTLNVAALNGTVALSPQPGQSGYVSGTVVTLTATGSNGYVFGSWSGDATGKTNPVKITMTKNMNVTAAFNVNQAPIIIPGSYAPVTPNAFPVSVALSNTTVTDDGLGIPVGYLLTTWSGPSGVTFDNTHNTQPVATFSKAGVYILTVTATDGQLQSSKQIQITVNGYNLAISAANGTVTANPSNVGSYVPGQVVTLTATPAAGYSLYSWSSNAVPSATNPLMATVTMNANTTVTASFTALTANAGANQNQAMQLPATIHLSGSVKAATSSLWSVVSGPGVVTFSDATNPVTTAVFSQSGSYVLALTASNGTSTPATSQVTINIIAAYTITVTAPNGSVTKSPNLSIYPAGTVVTLTPNPSNKALYQFGSWSGDVSASDNPLVMTINSNINLVANFAAINQAPVVSVGGNQAVNMPTTGNPPMASVNLSGTVRDDALPMPGNLTSTWSLVSYTGTGDGNVIFGTPSQTLTTKANTNMAANTTAKFSDPGTYVLGLVANDGSLSTTATTTVIVNPAALYSLFTNVSNAAYGSVTVSPLQTAYASGTQVTLTADPDPGYGFTSWSGNGSGTATSITITMNGNKSVNANFASLNTAPVANAGLNQEIGLPSNTIMLSGQIKDDGFPVNPGKVTATWSKVSGPGTVTFAPATQTLTTTPNASMAVNATASFSQAGTYVLNLTGNDGLLTSQASQMTVVVDPLPNYFLTVNASNGAVVLNPAQPITGYPLGTTVTMTAQPATGFLFSSWNGGASGTTNPVKFVINADNNNVTANFAVNAPPIVMTGVYDNATPLSGSLTLSGKVSDDGLPNPGTVTTSWTKVSGPGTVTLTNANPTISTQAKTVIPIAATAIFSKAGTYVLQLTANDGQLTTSKQVLITVSSS